MEYEQLGDVEGVEYQRRRPPPFPLAAITKLLTSCGIQIDQAAAAAAAFHETFGQAGTDEEEDLKKLELRVKQYLHELDQECGCQRRQPHKSTILGSASTSTSDGQSGTSTTGHSNEGGHSGGSGFFQKQVPPDTETQIEEEQDEKEEEEVDVAPKLQAFVRFPMGGYRYFYSPEMLEFSNVVDDLCTLCMEAEKSFFLEGVVQRQINHVRSHFANIRTNLRDAYTEYAKVSDIASLRGATDAAIDKKILINDLIVKIASHGGSKKTTRGRLRHAFGYLNARLRVAGAIIKMGLELPAEVLLTSNIPTTYSRRHDHIVGREKDVKLIRKHLMSKEKRVQVISVVGMLGIGKTALAHQIYGQYSVVCRFEVFTWAQYEREGGSDSNPHCLGDTWSEVLEKAFREKVIDHQMHQSEIGMYDQIFTRGGGGGASGSTSWNHYAMNILRKHKYLIIIDDITTTEAWDEVRKALPMDTMNGSRILLTTRHTKVALHAIHHQPGSPPPHQLRPLSDAESWELFTMKKVRHYSSSLVSIKKEIVKQCDGLPFAIEHLADHLSTQETKNVVWSQETKNDVWLKVLEGAHKQQDNYQTPWSYVSNMIMEELPINLKQCLFYFVLFPKDYAIPVRRLIALWVAEGFIEQKRNKTLECIAEEYLQELIDLNMVHVTKQKSNGRPKRCCLTYYLREHLSTRGMQTNYANTSDESSTSRSNKFEIHRLADHPGINGTMQSPDSYRSLLSFLSFDYREGYEPGVRVRNFLYGGITKGHFELLRVLDLEGIYKPGLPKEMGKLIHLKYLGLRWTYLDSFPLFIGSLINLQTLDVKHTYISTLPDSIWKLQQLRHVYLNECYLDNFVHQSSADYSENLQTLWGIHVDEESSVPEGLKRCTKITRLGVSCNLTSASQRDAMAKWISTLDLLQSLRFISKDRLGKLSVVQLLPFTTHIHLSDLYFLGQIEKLFEVDAFPPNLTDITLSASKLKEDPMLTLERLPSLRILKLYSDSYIGEHMVCSSSGFTRLEMLQIWKLETVKTWTVEEKSMPMLKKLEIRSCNKLERLPIGLQQITTLQELKLTEMPMKFIDEVKKDQEKGRYKKANVCFVDWRTSQV